MRRTPIARIGAGCAALLAVGGLAAAAQTAGASPPTASGDSIPAEAAPVASTGTTTLPLLGVPLTVEVATAPDGSLASVAVNPSQGLAANKVRPNRVAFVNEDGTAKVKVTTRHGGQDVDVTASSLADIVGPVSWSGDAFGDGTTTTVSFEIVAGADGSPDIVGISTSDPTAVVDEVQHDSSPRAQRARVRIDLTDGTSARSLWITASVWSFGDHTRAASSVALSDVRSVRLPADQVAGDHTWTGVLCDGTPVSVGYSVAADGTVTAGAVDPASGEVRAEGDGLRVRFSDHEGVRIRVSVRDEGLRISEDPKLRCRYDDPTVNTPVDPSAAEGRGSWGDWGDHDGRDRDGSERPGRGDGDGRRGSEGDHDGDRDGDRDGHDGWPG